MSGFQMLGVMQVKISTELGAENSIPGVALLDLFDSVELLKEFKADNNHPVYLLKCGLKSLKEFQDFSKNESLEILKIYEFNDSSAIFSAIMTGPIPQIISMFDEVWPTSPTMLNSDELILTLQGSSKGLMKARKQLIELLGDTFKISVNNNFQGQWDTAPGLPRRRKEVLETAIEMGYYNAPRKCRQRDIADSIGLKQGTVAEHLQIAESLIINAWFNQERN